VRGVPRGAETSGAGVGVMMTWLTLAVGAGAEVPPPRSLPHASDARRTLQINMHLRIHAILGLNERAAMVGGHHPQQPLRMKRSRRTDRPSTKETEGVTLVSTRQSPRQFPLHPYILQEKGRSHEPK
jgi:hypothetical protein